MLMTLYGLYFLTLLTRISAPKFQIQLFSHLSVLLHGNASMLALAYQLMEEL